ncbi:MAG: hypothetical protein AAB250_07045, partial [Bdellovibrionota bacterium]
RFVLNRGSISAISSKGEPIAHAFLEPRTVLAATGDYYTDKRYPRVEPNRAVLAQLYAFGDRKLNAVADIETQVYKYPQAEIPAVAAKPVVRSCEAMF